MVTILSWKSTTSPTAPNLSGVRSASATSITNRNSALLTSSHVYERPLGITELNFYWDALFARTADIAQSAEVEVVKRTGIGNLFTRDNISKTWTSMKQQFPLLAARIEPRGSEVFFVVDEDRLNSTLSTEVIFQTVASSDDVTAFVNDLIDVPRHLSNDKISQLFILSETDRPDFYHVIFHVTHCIADGVANLSFTQIFLDRLSSISSPPVWDIRRQLALSVSSEELVPQKEISIARRRWHQAIGKVLHTIFTSRFSGAGHTLPRKITKNTQITPALSRKITTVFPEDQSATIIHCCRANGLTFGHAYPVLAQIALARVLCRRYLRGDIDQEEWDFRRKQPMTMGGPLSVRPFLNQEWFKAGGAFNMNVAIAFFFHTLPFMPLGSAAALAPGAPLPSVEKMLSPARFFLRCNMIKQQSIKYMAHPYIFEKFRAAVLPNIQTLYPERVAKWQERVSRQAEDDGHEDEEAISAIQQAQIGRVLSHGGSSIGNIDNLVPLEYPLKREENAPPILRLHALSNKLRCRPAELYLGASTYRKRLAFTIQSDGNVFEDEVISEWLDEVKDATLFYLGQGTAPPLARL